MSLRKNGMLQQNMPNDAIIRQTIVFFRLVCPHFRTYQVHGTAQILKIIRYTAVKHHKRHLQVRNQDVLIWSHVIFSIFKK